MGRGVQHQQLRCPGVQNDAGPAAFLRKWFGEKCIRNRRQLGVPSQDRRYDKPGKCAITWRKFRPAVFCQRFCQRVVERLLLVEDRRKHVDGTR